MTVLFEDNISNYYGHFLKSYLGEGIIREHKCMIVDPETLRSSDHWVKFLPQVTAVKTQSQTQPSAKTDEESKSAQKLQVAWRYQD